MLAQRFEMIGSGVAFVARETVLRVDDVPLFHACVAMRFREDGSSRNGNAACVTFDECLLLGQNIQLHGVNEQVIRHGSELLERRSHRLPAGLKNVPRIDPLSVDFRNGPSECMFANPCGQFGAVFRGQFFRIVKADNPPLRIENHRGGNYRTKQRTTSGFVNSGDTRPAQYARGSLETGRAESAHWWEILARGSEPNSGLIVAVLGKTIVMP